MPGFLAALILPRGVDEGVMLAVAPVVTLVRAEGRSTLSAEGETAEGLEGKGGEDGEGLSKGVSLSSPSGVEAAESAMAESSERETVLGRVYCGVEEGQGEMQRTEEGSSNGQNKRADCYQVTMPPQRRAEGDLLAICGCDEVERTLRAPRVAVRCD